MGRDRLELLEQRLTQLEGSTELLRRGDPSIALGIDIVDLGTSIVAAVSDATGAQSIVANAWRVVNLDTIDIDTSGGGASPSTNRIIVRRTGIYLILYGVGFADTSTTTTRFIGYSVNSATTPTHTFGPIQVHSGTEGVRATSSHINTLEIGDIIRLMAFSRTTTLNTAADEGMPYLAIYLIGSL